MSLPLRKFLLFCGVSLYAGTTSLAWCVAPGRGASKTAPDLPSNAPSSPVIIQYGAMPSSAEVQQVTKLSSTTPVQLTSIKAIQATLSASALNTVSADGNVVYITPDRPLMTRSNAPAGGSIGTSAEYTVEPINAPAVWAKGYKGAGVGVALIDSGILNSSDLGGSGGGSRVVYNQSFIASQSGNANDSYGHGTHISGLIAGNGANSTGKQYFRTFQGVAPSANLVNLRVLDGSGQGTDTAVIQAIESAIALKSKYNIRIINLSLGRPIYESYTLDPLCQAVEQAWKAGIVVVAAAGNDGRDLALNTEGYGTIEAPGNDPYVITVGAVRTMGTAANTDDAMASYSSKGPSILDQVAKPDIVAPGNLVTGILAGGNALQKENPNFYTPISFYQSNGNPNNVSPSYMPLSGTSMATGVVSGAVALLLNANSALTPDQVKAILMANANKSILPRTSSVTDNGTTYTAHDDVFTVGAGYLDINAAVSAANARNVPAGTAMSPIASYDENSGDVSLVTDSTALWGKTSLWGAADVYGAQAFVAGNTALWGKSTVETDSTDAGSTVLWGKDDPAAFTALWGKTVLWGRGTTDATTVLWGRSTTTGASTSSSSSAMWGSTTLSGSTALWSTSVFLEH